MEEWWVAVEDGRAAPLFELVQINYFVVIMQDSRI
jgi:hypothetical protein